MFSMIPHKRTASTLLLVVLATSVSGWALDLPWVIPASKAEQADQLFDEGQYREAFHAYRELMRLGDTFSRYRIAYMYQHGLGVDRDPVEAGAWAILAAELKNPELLHYRDQLTESLDQQARTRAEERARELIGRYSLPAIARRMAYENRRQLQACTGSRLGTSCNPAGGIGSPVSATGQVHDGNSLSYRKAMESEIAALEGFIDVYINNRGRVELRDLETIEPEGKSDP